MLQQVSIGTNSLLTMECSLYVKKSLMDLNRLSDTMYSLILDIENDLEEFKEHGDAAFTEELEGHTLTDPDQVRFIRDMIANGHEDRLRYYHGRYGYEGAAVTTNYKEGISEDDIVRDTSVSLQRDNMGKYDTILYPVSKMEQFKSLTQFTCPSCGSDDIYFNIENGLDMIEGGDGYLHTTCSKCRKNYRVDVRIVYFPNGVEEL